MRSLDEILQLYSERRQERGPLVNAMSEIRTAYNGEVWTPLPEMDKNEQSFVANLITSGIDQYAMRIASTMPDVLYHPIRRGKDAGEERARTKRKVTLGWWQDNAVPRRMRRRARWFVGYGQAPVMIRPDPERKIPAWRLLHPLGTLPAPSDDPDDITPDDCITVTRRTVGQLKRMYGDRVERVHRNHPHSDNQWLTLLEYVDADEYVTAVIGDEVAASDPRPYGAKTVELDRVPNRAGMCLAVVPGRITLDRLQGQFDQSVGMHKMRARLMALEVIAAERGIMPDLWVVSPPGGTQAQIIQTPDWRQGRPGLIKGGSLEKVPIDPSFTSLANVDRLERNERVTAGVPGAMGGEGAQNMRTGRGVDTILAASVDFPVQEAQEVFADALREENRRAIAVQKAYFSGKHSYFVSWRNASGKGEYDVKDTFDSDAHTVRYSFPGTDLNGQAIRLGQKLGTGLISAQTARELDPEIEDAEREHDRAVSESLERALLASLEQQAAQGALPAIDVAKIMSLVRSNKMDLAEAVEEAQRLAQERQAQQAPPEAPEAQPGLAMPGAGAEAQPAIPEPEPSIQNLAGILGGLRRGQMMLPQERAN